MNAQQLVSLLYRKGAILSVENGNLQINAPDDALDDELLLQLKILKADIIALLDTLENSTAEYALGRHLYPSSYVCAASLAQQRILFMEELAGNNSYYNIPVVYKINGALDKAALCQSLSRLVARHDVLRSVYVLEDNTYVQHINEPAALQINEVSLINERDKDSILTILLEKDAHHLFNLACEWPIRASLIECDANEYVLSINIHHIAADGWSARRIISEISSGYQLYQSDIDPDIFSDPGRDYQYADYIQWQAAWRKSQQYQDAKNYWVASLKGAPELHSLPTDFIRPTIQSVAGDTYTQLIPTSLLAKISLCARTYQTTPFIIFQAAFAAFLARYSGESDIVFGTASANRQPLEFINTVGLFVNTLALRYAVPDGISFDALIKQAAAVSAQAHRFQQLPFDVVVDELQPARSLGYNPLVQLMLVMQDSAESGLRLDGAEVIQIPQRQKVSKFDLALHIVADKNGMSINWEYSIGLFKPATIQVMAAHLASLLDACLSMPEKNINCIPLVSADVFTKAVSPQHFPEPRCVHDLFERRVALAPDSIAVREDERVVTYHELNVQANHIASHLFAACDGKVGRIGVCMEKSTELLVGLLAIVKMGATYVPLDPYYPKERLDWMLQDSGISILLTSNDTKLPAGLDAVTQVLQVQTLLNTEIAMPYVSNADADVPAYIIYTSGSTGKPKGVLVSHRSLFYSLHANQSLMAMSAQDSMPTIGSQAFGVSLLEIFLPLISGGEVQVVKKAYIADIEQLIQRTNNVTVLHAVPSLMRQWLEAVVTANNPEQYPRLRLLLVGGESVPSGLLQKIKQWRPEIRLLELYGMTESTVVCSSYAANEAAHPHYCIGKPHPNTLFYVLNSHGQQQPIGVPGELHIGGLSLASEYINQPEITAEKFIVNPYLQGGWVYKTGDRVRLLDDGNYEFLGRVDHQVSLRGVRIELGEIETLAAGIEGVKQAVAYVSNIGDDEKTLVLYYTSHTSSPGHVVLSEFIRAHLARYLPDYMRPSIIQHLDLFPLNPNGKVDRNKLPSPYFAAAIVEPETELEQRLVEMWKSILRCDSVNVTANFFEMGGHSLMATRLVNQIRAEFAISLPLTALFESPTIRSCAQCIEHALREKYAQSLIQHGIHDAIEDDELIF
jgi:amino acid adenylation domain-containing protein